MAGTPRVTLGGIHLGGADTYDWSLRYGTQPHSAIWTVATEVAEALQDKLGQPQELRFEGGPRKDGFWRNIYPLEIYPGDGDNFTKRLLVKDLRWRWPYEWLKATFNLRRLTGERFIVSDNGTPPELIVTDPKLIYEPTTLRPFGDEPGSSVWTPKEVLRYLLQSPEPEGLGEAVQIDFDDPEVPIIDLEIDDSGSNAIERVLKYLSGVDLYVSRSGSVVVTDTRDGSEEEVLKRLNKGRLTTGPNAFVVKRTAVRPRSVVSLFTPEPEVLFRFTELVNSGTSQTDFGAVDDTKMRNVAPVPDVSVTIGTTDLARGSYAETNDLMAAWGAFGVAGETLKVETLRSRFLEAGGARLEFSFSHASGGAFDAEFAARIEAILSSWRQLYRIAPTFFGRLGSIAPVRAAILNTETGTRAPSPVYSDYMRFPTERGVFKRPGEVQQGWIVRGYDGGFAVGGKVAPANIEVVDAGVGVLRVLPRRNPHGLYQELILGYPSGKIPEIGGLGAANRTGDEARALRPFVKLDSDYNLATILSVTPSTPQNRGMFYARETIVPGGTGPKLYSRIFPGIVTARFGWSDARAENIRDAIRGRVPWASLTDLLVNDQQLEDVAQANKKRILDSFRDRVYGGIDVDMDPALEPTGALAEVRQIMAGGALVSQLRFPEDFRPLDLWRFLDSSTRRALTKALLSPQQGSVAR